MKYGFNMVTIRAEEQLWKSGLRIVREDNSHVSVYSDQVSSVIEGRDIEEPKHTFGQVDSNQGDYQKDLASLMVLERVHMWWNKLCSCPDNTPCVHDNPCYYL